MYICSEMAFCQKKEKGLTMYKLREYLETVVGMPTKAVPNAKKTSPNPSEGTTSPSPPQGGE